MSPSKLILCLVLVIVLQQETSGRKIACKQLNEECILMTNSCCPGMKCEKGQHNDFRCRQSSGIGRCQSHGQICTPGVNDNCCSGLSCRARIVNPSVHECR